LPFIPIPVRAKANVESFLFNIKYPLRLSVEPVIKGILETLSKQPELALKVSKP